MMLSANNAWRERNPRPTMNFIQKNWKGILVCLVMAVPCWLLGQRFPIVGGPVFGILAGMIVTLLWHDKSAAQPGISFVSKKVLQYAVILLGFGILQVGLSLKSHDPSQRANGILTVAGGIVITFTKEILTLITG